MLSDVLNGLRRLDAREVYVVLQECVSILEKNGIEITGHKVPKYHSTNVPKRKGQGRIKPKWTRCGKLNCGVCASGGKHGPYFVEVVRNKKTGKEREIYLGKSPRKRRRGKQ